MVLVMFYLNIIYIAQTRSRKVKQGVLHSLHTGCMKYGIRDIGLILSRTAQTVEVRKFFIIWYCTTIGHELRNEVRKYISILELRL